MKKIIIFGCGYHGRAAFRKILNIKNYKFLFWVDNNKNIQNKYLFNKKIISLENLKTIQYDKIIFCGRHINDQLKLYFKFNLNRNKILVWDFFKLLPSKQQVKKRDNELYKILKQVINKLDKNKIHYWADSSGLLSLVRKDNISILSDFDLAFDKKFANKLSSLFVKETKYKILMGSYIRSGKKFPKIAFLSKNNKRYFEPAVLDCVFYYKKKNTYYKYGNNRIKFPAKYIKPIKKLKFKDINISIPHSYKEYLSNFYGKKFMKKVKFYSNPLIYKKFIIKKKII